MCEIERERCLDLKLQDFYNLNPEIHDDPINDPRRTSASPGASLDPIRKRNGAVTSLDFSRNLG